mgnify:CR=1 FL=1
MNILRPKDKVQEPHSKEPELLSNINTVPNIPPDIPEVFKSPPEKLPMKANYIIPFITAIILSSIAAYYSIIGLAQIFPGAFWPIVIMGGALEVAKYNNWKETAFLMKTYFLVAIVLLMLITSMGIFGFLSKAHIDTNIMIGSNQVKIQMLDQREYLLNNKLQYLLKKAGDDPEKISRKTNALVLSTQKELEVLITERLPLLSEENKLSAEIGPIKYVAELVYGYSDKDIIDKAVRLVILIIIFVFDPLAVLLLVASNMSYRQAKNREELDILPFNDVPSTLDKNNKLIPKSSIMRM